MIFFLKIPLFCLYRGSCQIRSDEHFKSNTNEVWINLTVLCKNSFVAIKDLIIILFKYPSFLSECTQNSHCTEPSKGICHNYTCICDPNSQIDGDNCIGMLPFENKTQKSFSHQDNKRTSKTDNELKASLNISQDNRISISLSNCLCYWLINCLSNF